MELLLWAAVVIVSYLIYEQLHFMVCRKRGGGKTLAGPRFPLPLLGGILYMVRDPFSFWEDQRKYAFPGISYNSVFGKLVVHSTDAELNRKIFSTNSKDSLMMILHPSGKNILGPSNLAFQHGPAHKAIRKSFLALFTRKALSTYVQLQDGIIRRHIHQWLDAAAGTDQEVRPLIRDLNAYTSQEVFAGAYLDDPQQRDAFSQAYRDMTDGFLAFPLCVPGTAVWRARAGRIYIVKVLTKAAARSKDNMKAGREPQCLMDFWAQRCLQEIEEAGSEGVPLPAHVTDTAMADTVMDFLFASQDASTASLVWTLVLMAEFPAVLAKVREEQLRVRPDLSATITGDTLNEMSYTRAVVKEILRYRPPAPMVPQIAQNPFPMTADYSAPKGAIIVPHITAACMQGFSDPLKFDPDRFSAERQEDIKFATYFQVFGFGPHYCAGKEYAVNQLMTFLAIASTSCDWTRRRTEKSDDWKYLPTIYPYDSFITLTPRMSA